MLEILGERLSQQTGKGAFECMGLIRLAIKDAGKDPRASLGYIEWRWILEHPLHQRLIRLSIKNPLQVIDHLNTLLWERRSLLTMSVRLQKVNPSQKV